MTKDIKIEYALVKTPTEILVDGKQYPIHKHNIEVVREFEATRDETVLDKLVDFALKF